MKLNFTIDLGKTQYTRTQNGIEFPHAQAENVSG